VTTTDISGLQLLPEREALPAGAHIALSCHVTCPVDTSDSLPSDNCAD
jgi:hypothetical protein